MKAFLMPPSKKQRAFTLIEMLVVLVIVGLLITVVMQGFAYSLGLYQRVTGQQKNTYSEVLAYNWLRSTLSNTKSPRINDLGLVGTADQVSVDTYEPLIVENGVKTSVMWSLIQNSEGLDLTYTEQNQILNVFHWSMAVGRWEYMDQQNTWHPAWPADKENARNLPKAIRLIVTSGNDTLNYVMVLNTRFRSDVRADDEQNAP